MGKSSPHAKYWAAFQKEETKVVALAQKLNVSRPEGESKVLVGFDPTVDAAVQGIPGLDQV